MSDSSQSKQFIQLKDQIHRAKNNEPFMVQGARRIWFQDDDGPWKLHYEECNVIVNLARKIMAHLLGDCTGDYQCVNQFKVGGDNTLTGAEMLSPNSPTVSDTDLVYTSHVFVREKSDTGTGGESLFEVSYPNAPNETSVLYSISLLKTEANILDPNPTVFVCAGLFSIVGANTFLFASQSFPVITKTPNRAMKFEWEIRF